MYIIDFIMIIAFIYRISCDFTIETCCIHGETLGRQSGKLLYIYIIYNIYMHTYILESKALGEDKYFRTIHGMWV